MQSAPVSIRKPWFLTEELETLCGVPVPSATKAPPVGFYDEYPHDHLHFCKRCKVARR